MTANPHLSRPVHRFGASSAVAVAVVVHGRAQDPAWMREHLLDRLPPLPVAYLVPEAADGSWYPARFMEPLAPNEPWLSWTLARIDTLVEEAVAGGVDRSRLALVGFSQGAARSSSTAPVTPPAMAPWWA